MQRTAFKAACYRVLSKLNLQQKPQQRDYHQCTVLVQDGQDGGTTETAPRSLFSSLDLLGRLLHGRLYLLGGRPVPPRFLRLLTGDRTLSFSSDEDEEFRRQLGMQLKELRDVLRGNQETEDLDLPQETESQEETGPYASAGSDALTEDLTEKDREDIRTVRMAKRAEGGDAETTDEMQKMTEQSEVTSEAEDQVEEEDVTRSETEEVADPHHQMRDGEVEGVYWTGDGERIVTVKREKPRQGPSGYISGEGEEVPAIEDRPMPGPRSQVQEQNLTSDADSDE